MDALITEFNQEKRGSKNTIFKTNFEIKNISVALANCLRRSFSTLTPTVGFDDTYFNNEELNSINIKTNTSSLHNEFISHRLSLIPINMTNHNNLQISTHFDKQEVERKWKFLDVNKVPHFIIDMKNDSQHDNLRDKEGLIDITTDTFNIFVGETQLNTLNFFPHDLFTGEPILINKLKYNISNQDNGEELLIICRPTIGLGKYHSRYDPTGTVEYSFKIDKSRVELVLKLKLEYLEEERKNKGLEPYTPKEIQDIKKSYHLLDKQRVFLTNKQGKANHLLFSIESIGFMSSSQIIIDAINTLELMIIDVKNCFEFVINKSKLELNLLDKVQINEFGDDNVNRGCIIKVKNENHTLGNLIQHYLRKSVLYPRTNLEDEVFNLKIGNYRMDHPTIEEIEFILGISSKTTKTSIINYISHIKDQHESKGNVSNLVDILREINYEELEEENIINLTNIFCVLQFIIAINKTLIDIKDIKKKFIQKTNINQPSFTIIDSEEYRNMNKLFVN